MENQSGNDELHELLAHRDHASKVILETYSDLSREELVVRIMSWMTAEAVDSLVWLIQGDRKE